MINIYFLESLRDSVNSDLTISSENQAMKNLIEKTNLQLLRIINKLT